MVFKFHAKLCSFFRLINLSLCHIKETSYRSSQRRCSVRNGVQAAPATLLKKESLAQVFFCEFFEISKITFLTHHLWETASEVNIQNFISLLPISPLAHQPILLAHLIAHQPLAHQPISSISPSVFDGLQLQQMPFMQMSFSIYVLYLKRLVLNRIVSNFFM